MATMKISAFDVVRCGYYKKRNDNPVFGSLPDTLIDLKKWVSGKSLSETKTFEPGDDDVFPVYCFDIHHSQDKKYFLITTWNEVPTGEEGIAVASGSSRVGAVDVETTEVGEGGIPGFPTYFYFMTDENLVFSVRPERQRHSGHNGLIQYMKSFLHKAASYVVINEDADDVDNHIIGYRPSPEGKITKVYPSYLSKLKRLPGQTEHLQAHRTLIRKIVRIDTLNLSIPKDRHLVGKVLENMGWLDRKIVDQSMRFRYELDFQPNEEELNMAIQTGVEPQRPSRTGFVLSGSQDIYWLDHAYAKDDLVIHVSPDSNGVIDGLELLSELSKMHRQLEGIASGDGGVSFNDEEVF